MNSIEQAKLVFDKEIEALQNTRDALGPVFLTMVEAFVGCKGKVITVGIGKSGHVARKIAATLSSLGTPSVFLSPSESLHGDIGMVSGNDVVLLISNSGECEEIKKMLPAIKRIGARITAITGIENSTIAREAEICQVLPFFEEAGPFGLVPTSSTTATMCYGDALAIVISIINEFGKEEFQKNHPAGSLGRK